MLVAPRLAHRDCQDCVRHVYDEHTGARVQHLGLPVVRPPGTAPPCRLPHAGCLKGTPEEQNSLTPANLQAWRFDRECRASNSYPNDPIVRRHAALIRAVELQSNTPDP